MDPSKIVEQIWSGTVRSLKGDDFFCVYSPSFYVKGRSTLAFMAEAHLKRSLRKLNRLVIVNLGDVKAKLRTELEEFGYVDP